MKQYVRMNIASRRSRSIPRAVLISVEQKGSRNISNWKNKTVVSYRKETHKSLLRAEFRGKVRLMLHILKYPQFDFKRYNPHTPLEGVLYISLDYQSIVDSMVKLGYGISCHSTCFNR